MGTFINQTIWAQFFLENLTPKAIIRAYRVTGFMMQCNMINTLHQIENRKLVYNFHCTSSKWEKSLTKVPIAQNVILAVWLAFLMHLSFWIFGPRGHLTDYLPTWCGQSWTFHSPPTSSCPRSFWMTPNMIKQLNFFLISGGLGSYTPSKMATDTPFQLGVSRTVPHASSIKQTTNSVETTKTPSSTNGTSSGNGNAIENPDEVLRPTDDAISWSGSSSSSDMLFWTPTQK